MEFHRQDAIRFLSEALTADRVTVEQFESRLALVRQAPNRASIDAIVADLVPTGPVTPTAVQAHQLEDLRGLAPIEPASVLRIATVFGSTKRAGTWTVPLRLELRAVLGELVIDLRDAEFWSDVLDIDLHATMGSVTLIVPAGAQVENECEERFSSSTHSIRSVKGRKRIGLLIRITGLVRFSSLDIKEKRPSSEEGEMPAWKRLLGGGD